MSLKPHIFFSKKAYNTTYNIIFKEHIAIYITDYIMMVIIDDIMSFGAYKS
jgi:hypothetical protein